MISILRVAATRAVSRAAATVATPRVFVASSSQMAVCRRVPVMTRHLASSAPPAFLNAAEVTDRIVTVVKNFDQVDASKVTPETKFADDLGLDSLDIVEVVMAIEDEFAIEIPDQEADKITSIAEAVEYISSHPMAK